MNSAMCSRRSWVNPRGLLDASTIALIDEPLRSTSFGSENLGLASTMAAG